MVHHDTASSLRPGENSAGLRDSKSVTLEVGSELLRGKDSDPAFLAEDESSTSYGELRSLVCDFAARLTAGRGLMLLNCSNTRRAIVAFLAAFEARVPVYLTEGRASDDSANTVVNRFRCLYRYDSATDDLVVIPDHSQQEINIELAVMLSTSGSTGAAKSVRLSRSNILSNARSIADYLGLSSRDRAPTLLPFHYSYGMSVVTSHLVTGGSLMVTDRSVIEPEFWDAFDRNRCTSLAGVPHTFGLLEKSGIATSKHSSLRYITQAGGKLDPAKIVELAKRGKEEGWKFYVMYGQTEASPRIAYLPPEIAEQYPNCIGVAIPGGTLSLQDEAGNEITQPDVAGELLYRGPNVMMGYAESAADLAKGAETEVLCTGDMACRNAAGLYYIVGRKKRFIKPFGLRISLDEVESRLAAAGYDAACGGNDDGLSILLAKAHAAALVRQEVATWLSLPVSAISIIPCDFVPRNDSGKIDGLKVATLLAGAPKPPKRSVWNHYISKAMPALKMNEKGDPSPILGAFQKHLPMHQIDPNQSFVDLGGDSLSYIGLAMDLEDILGKLPENWQNMSVRELQSLGQAKATAVRPVETATFLRALSIVTIVAGHFEFIKYGGGASYLLLAISGFNFGRYQLAQCLKLGSVKPVLRLAGFVAALTMAYIIAERILRSKPLDLHAVFLHSNWIDPRSAGALWFIEVYVQVLAVMALLLLLPPVRAAFARNAFATALGFFVFATVLSGVSQLVWDAHELYRRLPHLMLWLFAVGMAAEAAQTTRHRVLLTLTYVLAALAWSFGRVSIGFLDLGVLLLIWVPEMSMTAWVKRVTILIAQASLFIYLTHFNARSVIQGVYDGGPALNVVFALAFGVFLSLAFNEVYFRAAKLLRPQHQRSVTETV